MASVLVCDDSPLARESIRRAVAAIPGVDRVGVDQIARRVGHPGPEFSEPRTQLVDVVAVAEHLQRRAQLRGTVHQRAPFLVELMGRSQVGHTSGNQRIR